MPILVWNRVWFWGNYGVVWKLLYVSIPSKKRKRNMRIRMDLRKSSCWSSNLINDNIISAFARFQNRNWFLRPGMKTRAVRSYQELPGVGYAFIMRTVNASAQWKQESILSDFKVLLTLAHRWNRIEGKIQQLCVSLTNNLQTIQSKINFFWVSMQRYLKMTPSSWFETTWQGCHVGGQYNRIFSRRIYMKIEFSSQTRGKLLKVLDN